NGTLSAVSGNSVTYTPSAGFSGTDTFTYKANDGLNDSNTATASIVVNRPPVANADAGVVVAGGATTGNVLTNDTDADGDALTAALASNASNGTATVATNGAYTYTHDGSATTTDSFTYTVSDGNGGTATGIVSITVTNQAPTATDVSTATATATAVTVTLAATDPEGLPLTYSIVSTPSNGTLSAVTGATVIYTPSAGFSGPDTFTFKANDGINDSNTATATVVVNGPPVATGDSGTVVVGGTTSGNVLTNDTDPNSDALTAALATNPANGAATVAANGDYTYTHNGSATTSDSFTYTVSDGNGGTAAGTVSITVTNQAPTAVAVSAATGQETAVAVTFSATDPEGLPLTYAIVANPSNGTLSAVSGASVTYTPGAGFSGTDTFTYRASDGLNNSNTATATIVVNGTPVANADAGLVVVGGVTTGNVLTNDTDPDGDALTATLASNPANGAVTLGTDGAYTYTHNGSATTSDSFTYTVSDGNGGTATGTVSITTQNQAPTAVSVSASTGTATAVVVTFSASDPESQALAYSIVTTPSNGTLSAVSGNSVTYTPSAGFSGTDTFTYKANDGLNDSNTATASVMVNGAPVANADTGTVLFGGSTSGNVLTNDTDPDGDALTATLASNPSSGTATVSSNGAYTYTHNGSAATSDSFTYTANDGNGGTATGTVTIAVQNQAPTALDLSISTTESRSVPIGLSATDPEGSSLTYLVVTTVTNGFLSPVVGNFVTYTPNPGFSGSDTFTYKANDGTTDSNIATVVIVVNGVPIANGDAFSVGVGGSVAGNVLSNDSDPNGDALTVALATNPVNGTATLASDGALTYTHSGSATASDSFTYTVTDVNGGTATGTVTITVLNQAPTASNLSALTPAGASVTVTLSATDSEGLPLVYSIVSTPTNGTLSAVAGTAVTYTPNGGFFGTDTFTYKASDGLNDSNVATVTVVVNGAPAVVSDAFSVILGGTVSGNVLANDTDPNGDALTAAIADGPSNGTVSLESTGLFTYTHDGSATSTDSFTYTASDGNGGTATGTVSITVSNHTPVATELVVTAEANTAVLITLAATDPEEKPLTYSIVIPPASGTLSPVSGATVLYTPNNGFQGTDLFTYAASDGVNTSVPATVAVTVNAPNLPPVVQPDGYAGPEDTILTVPAPGVLSNDSDPNGHAIQAALETSPDHGVVTLLPDGSFTYTPDPNYFGPDAFTYVAADAQSVSTAAMVTLVITPVNDKPTVQNATLEAVAGIPAQVTLVGADVEGSALTFALIVPPQNGDVTMAGNVATYTATSSFRGTDDFFVRASDGTSTSELASVTVTVTGNDAPLAVPDTYTVDEDDVLSVNAAGGVLSNDTDVDGDPLTAVLVVDASHGNISLNPDGGFFYEPDVDFFGQDSFGYQATDGMAPSETAFATITVNPTGSARLQIVLNAPDDAVNPGDIYLNGELVARRAPYLFAGPFQDVQDGPVQVSLAPGGTNIGAAVATLSGTLEEDGTYIAVISGTGSLGYQLHLIDPAREASLTTGVQVAFYHGSPDTPTVDLVALPDNVEVGHDLTFGAFTPYVNNAASTYDFSVRLALGSQLDIFRIGLTTPGAAHLVMLTGLLADSSPSEKTSATYPLTMVGVNGDGTTSGSIVVTAIEPSSDLVPKTFLLRGNYPNPFNPRTNVQFDLPEAAEVEVRVTDLLGREVLAVPLQSMSAGTNLAIPLDATELASGIYIYRVEAHAANEHYVAVGTMTLIK
ncbi:MAG: VCBS repeat-containing protein, partial [Rhodothermales bacterium]